MDPWNGTRLDWWPKALNSVMFGLRGYFQYCGEANHNSIAAISCCCSEVASSSVGYLECLLAWYTLGEGVYEVASRI